MTTPADLDGPALCDALEVTNWQHQYDRLLCAGIERMDAGRHLEAIESFEQALSIDFYEAPNVQLFPRLALAYFKAGDMAMATSSLRKAELSLSVLSGVMRCVEVDLGPEMQPVYRLTHVISTGPSVDEEQAIADRMCWPTKSGFRGRFTSLEQVVAVAALVEYYFDVRDTVLDATSD